MKLKAVRWSYKLHRNAAKDMFLVLQQLTQTWKRQTDSYRFSLKSTPYFLYKDSFATLITSPEINFLLSMNFHIAFTTDETIID